MIKAPGAGALYFKNVMGLEISSIEKAFYWMNEFILPN